MNTVRKQCTLEACLKKRLGKDSEITNKVLPNLLSVLELNCCSMYEWYFLVKDNSLKNMKCLNWDFSPKCFISDLDPSFVQIVSTV